MGAGLLAESVGRRSSGVRGVFAPARADESLQRRILRDAWSRSRCDGGGCLSSPTALLVSGMIGPGSYEEFHAAADARLPSWWCLTARVACSARGAVDRPGNSPPPSYDRGRSAHRSCASACAVVFPPAARKLLGSGASIGLHSASYADGRCRS